MKIITLVFVSLLLLPAASKAAQMENGQSPYTRGDYQGAMNLLRPLADQGDATAQFGVGWMYWNGISVKPDAVEAVKWYRKAADNGDARAQFNLGLIYWWGMGNVPRDYTESAKWYRKAADQGDNSAQISLGKMYEYGAGVPRDLVQAYLWCSVAQAANSRIPTSLVDGIAAKMTQEQLAKAKRLAGAWKPKSANREIK
jgi:TPR repeat protein